MYSRLALLLLAGVLIVGCAGPELMQDTQPFSADIKRHKVVEVAVSGTEQVRQNEAFASTSTDLRSEIVAKLRGTGRFAEVAPQTQAPDAMMVQVLVTDFSYVHSVGRLFGGFWAGTAKLEATVTLKDKSTGVQMGESRFAASAKNGPRLLSRSRCSRVRSLPRSQASEPDRSPVVWRVEA